MLEMPLITVDKYLVLLGRDKKHVSRSWLQENRMVPSSFFTKNFQWSTNFHFAKYRFSFYKSVYRLHFAQCKCLYKNGFVQGNQGHYSTLLYGYNSTRALIGRRAGIFSCNDRALWNFFSAQLLFWVVSKATSAWAETTKKMYKIKLYFQ